MINLRYFCFVVIQLYLKVRALALFYFINLHHYTYITLVSVGDTSGLRFQCPSRCTKVQYQVKNTSGWANIGRFRCIASNRQISPKQNTSEFSNFIQSRCISLISREYTRSPSRSISPRKQVKHKKYIGIQHIIAIPMYFINYLRFYLLSRAVFMSCILPRCSGYARWD